MNRQELLLEVKSILEEKKLKDVGSDGFLAANENKYLKDAFDQIKLHKGKQNEEKWHQFVRFAAEDPEKIRYMYDRLIRLIINHRRNFDDYFKIKSEESTFHMPDRQWNLQRLLILFEEYFEIYRKIMQNIYFEFPAKEYREPYIRGKINWDKTLRKSSTKFPLNFDTNRLTKIFLTPANTLLILGALWLNKEVREVSNMEFTEELTEDEKSILGIILQNSQTIINAFPFSDVLANARKFTNLDIEDKRVLELLKKTQFDVSNGKIRNKKYLELIQWMEKFHQLNLRLVSESITNFPLETLENLDTIYEAWIFFEMIDYYSKKGKLVEVQLKDDPNYFIFEHDGIEIEMRYDYKFSKDKETAWAVGSKPDYTVLVGDTIIATFDAKNYSSSERKPDAIHKILAYMTNLDCGFGALFFPKFETISDHFPKTGEKSFYHHDLTVYHYQMKPAETDEALEIKQKTLDSMHEEIIKKIGQRLPLTRQN